MGDSVKDSKCMRIKRKLVEKSNGFSLDIGGSVAKIVYLAKDEWENRKPDEDPEELVNLYMKSYSRDDMEPAIAFIKESVYIKRGSPDANPVIYTTGLGSNMMKAELKEELHITVQNTMEFDDFILALEFLMESFSHEEVFIPVPKKGFSEGIRRCTTTIQALEGFGTEMMQFTKIKLHLDKFGKVISYITDMKAKLDRGEPLPRAMPKIYPYMLGQLGSGFAFLKVDADGSYIIPDILPFAGRTFLDLGRTITGAKTYADLIALAEAGVESNLNIAYKDSVSTQAGDIYKDSGDELVIYSFGKLHGKHLSEVNKSDLARTLLQTICLMSMGAAHQYMMASKCRNLYLTGSFVNSEVTQNLLFQEFEAARTRSYSSFPEDLSIADQRMEIADCSEWLGCLGAFITGCNGSD